MKQSLLTLALATWALSSFAQVMETEHVISLGLQPAFMIDHEGADEKMVFKFLEDYYDEYGDVDRNRKAKEWKCEGCKIPVISTKPMNVYFKVKEGKGQATSYHFFDDGSKFVTSSDETHDEIEVFLINIKNELRREVLKKQIKEQEEKLEDLNEDLEDLVDDNKDLHEDIQEYHEKIRKAEQDIEKNLENQADKRMEIEKQRRVIEEVTNRLNNVGRG